MKTRISVFWWPAMLLASPVLLPWLFLKTRRFRAGENKAVSVNKKRMESARPLDLPALKEMEITVVVEHAHEEGFLGDAGVSYFIRTDRGALMMDVGFGRERPAFPENARKLGLTMEDADALVISHLHPDHMGGMAAVKNRTVVLPEGFAAADAGPCYVPDECSAERLEIRRATGPRVLEAGVATTGPLARMLFFFGFTEEQALVARLEGKGLVIVTGCGHPGIEVILRMVARLSGEPVHAVCGGLHFPITQSRGARMGVQTQQVFGTGKPCWERITDGDLTRAVEAIKRAGPKRLLLSAHDSCDHALERLSDEVDAEAEILRAGAAYRF